VPQTRKIETTLLFTELYIGEMRSFTIFFVFTFLRAWPQGTWTKMADFPGTARSFAAGFAVGTKGYMGTGMDALGNNLNDFWEYNPSTDTWTQKANFPGVARNTAVGFGIGTKGYIGTGTGTSDFYEYNPSTNTWVVRAAYGGGIMSGSCGFGISSSGKGYLGGAGLDNLSNFTKKFYEYDQAGNTWTVRASPPFVLGPTPPMRYYAVAFAVGTKGYITSGGSCCGGNAKDLYEFNPATNSWVAKANYTAGFGLWEATGFGMGSKGYLVTGEDDASAMPQTLREWDQAGNTWTNMANFPGTGRVGSVSFVVNSCAYIIAGRDNSGTLKEVWRWCSSVPLAVELTEFKATNQGTVNKIEWQTLSETNHSHFILERSIDAFHFYPVKTIPGSGDNRSKKQYSFTDEWPEGKSNIIYYRLQSVDKSGRSSNSEMISVKKQDNTKAPLYYFDEMSRELHVFYNFEDSALEMQAYGGDGKMIISCGLTNLLKDTNHAKIEFPAVVKGICIIKFTSATGDIFTSKVLVN
jgi:N-acetylneuraminic acid mutarotase